MTVTINLSKAKLIAHDQRRAMRAADFAPWDEIISKQIPGTAADDAEAARQLVRDRYADMQLAIDAALSPEELIGILSTKPESA